MSKLRIVLVAVFGTVLVAPAWAGHTLAPQEKRVLAVWLAQHPSFRAATNQDCSCAEDIQEMKAGDGGVWRPVPDYHPYVATGDFNGDGIRDFAVAVIERTKSVHPFTLLVFNGPFDSDGSRPAFIGKDLDLRYMGLSFGPPRPKPYSLIVGRFGSDNTSILIPSGTGYQLK